MTTVVPLDDESKEDATILDGTLSSRCPTIVVPFDGESKGDAIILDGISKRISLDVWQVPTESRS